MSTITTPGGPVIGVAVLRIPVVPESDTHAHNAQHAQVVHQHVNVDVPESFSAKNIQVSPNGTYVAGMPAGIVTEFATVTGKLDVIDDAYINVQPDPDKHETSVWSDSTTVKGSPTSTPASMCTGTMTSL